MDAESQGDRVVIMLKKLKHIYYKIKHIEPFYIGPDVSIMFIFDDWTKLCVDNNDSYLWIMLGPIDFVWFKQGYFPSL